MKISYDWLNSYFDRGLFSRGLPRASKLADLFNAHFAEVEGMEKAGGDTILEVKTLADRNHYALCHRGMAREASVITGKALKASAEPKIAPEPGIRAVAVKVTDPKLCRRYAARRVDGVKVAASPQWLSERLEAVGARSINNIVDATNYVMFDIGQPLHAFDAEKVKGGIAVRLAKTGEKITILDGREIKLKETDLVIADDEGPLAIAGVKGGKRAEVTTDTRSIIIESANFDPSSVRRTSTRANLRNDSSKRFENEITPALAGEAIERVTDLILKVAGGKPGSITDVYPNPAKPWKVSATSAMISSMVGAPVSVKEIQEILENQGAQVHVLKDCPSCGSSTLGDRGVYEICEVCGWEDDPSQEASPDLSGGANKKSLNAARSDRKKGNEVRGAFVVIPPLDRLDLVIPEDLADEVMRVRGYENIPSVQTPPLDEPTPLDRSYYVTERVKNNLVALGFTEAYTYTLVPKGAFEVSYPLASDKSALRERIAPKLADALAMNARNADLLGLDAIKMFEIGKVFPASGEKLSLAVGATLVKKKKGVTAESLVKEALVAIGVDAVAVKVENGVAEIDFDAFVAAQPTVGTIADLDFRPLSKDVKYKPFSAYPFMTRDIAFFAPAGTDAAAARAVVAGALNADVGAGKSLVVKGPDQFDRFEKDGKVSYGFRVVFQAFDRTLSDEEANAEMKKAYDAVKAKGWEVR